MRRSEPQHAPRRPAGVGPGRMMLGATVVLAAGGAAVLALTDDARWLRLGIVAALWAALAGAFAAARYRREAAAGHDNGDEQLRIYQLELEREVAARREHELQVEADTRRRLEAEVRTEVHAELDGLRAELRTLRQNLEALLGGELLVERVALRAESTRLRSLSDKSVADRALPSAGPHTSSWPATAVRLQPQRPVPAEPLRAQPVGAAPVRAQPVRAQPVRAQPVRAQPGQAPPAASQAVPARSVPAQPARARPQSSGPQSSGPQSSGPQRDAPPIGSGQSVGPAERTQVMGRYQPQPASTTAPQNAQPAGVDPLTTPDWDRFEQWTPSEPPDRPAPALADGGSGRRRRADEQAPTEQPVTGYNGGRRRAPDTGVRTTSRSVDDLLAAHRDDRQPRRRHGRAEG